MTEESPFAEPTWAIVELFGRQVIAGQISEISIAGTAMLRVDVPVDQAPAFTKFFGGAAIYAITPTDEASARHAATYLNKTPIEHWVIPFREQRRSLPDPSPFGPPDHEEWDREENPDEEWDDEENPDDE